MSTNYTITDSELRLIVDISSGRYPGEALGILYDNGQRHIFRRILEILPLHDDAAADNLTNEKMLREVFRTASAEEKWKRFYDTFGVVIEASEIESRSKIMELFQPSLDASQKTNKKVYQHLVKMIKDLIGEDEDI